MLTLVKLRLKYHYHQSKGDAIESDDVRRLQKTYEAMYAGGRIIHVSSFCDKFKHLLYKGYRCAADSACNQQPLMTLVDLLSLGTFCNMMWLSKWRMENLKRSPTFQHQLNGMLGILSVTGIQNLQRFGRIISSQLFQNMPFMSQWEDSSLAVSVKYQVPHLRHQQEKVHEIILLPNSFRVQHYGALIYGK